MNERLVYEWLSESDEIVQEVHDGEFVWTSVDMEGNYHSRPCLPLDMNTWHGEVVPKLLSEGAEVHFVTNQNNHNERHHNIYAQGCYEPFSDSGPYEALTEYLEAQ